MLFCICFYSWSIKKSRNVWHSVVSNDFSLILYCPEKYKTQRMFESVVSEDPSLIVYSPTQRIWDEVADDCLAALKFVPDWFVTNGMIKKMFYFFVCRWKYTLA